MRAEAWRRKDVFFVKVGRGRQSVVFELESAELAGELVARALVSRRLSDLLGFAMRSRSVSDSAGGRRSGAVKGREAGAEGADP